MSRRALVAPVAALLLLASCGEAPRPAPSPAPQRVNRLPYLRDTLASEETESAVLAQLAPVVARLLVREWGRPPSGERWNLRVAMRRHDRLDPPFDWLDTTLAPTPRARTRARFRQAVEDALGPTAHRDARDVAASRFVAVGHMVARGDSIGVRVDVGAAVSCGRPDPTVADVSYSLHFRRTRGGEIRRVGAPADEGGTTPLPPGSCGPRRLLRPTPWPPPPACGTASYPVACPTPAPKVPDDPFHDP